MGVDFSESSWSTEQKNGLKKKFTNIPSKAEGGRLVKEADFEAENFFLPKKII